MILVIPIRIPAPSCSRTAWRGFVLWTRTPSKIFGAIGAREYRLAAALTRTGAQDLLPNSRASGEIHIMSEHESARLHGRYEVECIGADGKLKWRDHIDNVVATVGKNLLLDTILAGAAYTVTGPFMGLISNISFTTGPVAGDTMASHGGWTEAGGTNAPTYTAPRKTAVFSAASGGAKALSAALSFVMTSGSNVIVKGCFIVYGTGAVSTIDSTAGVLLSAGLFSGGDKTVSSGDTINVTYTLSV